MRNYKRKTERGKTSETLLRRAADAVIKEGKPVKTVARELEICHMTLHRFVTKLKAGKVPTIGYKPRLVFTLEQEKELANYILKCSSIYFGLLPGEVRKLAYECAVKFSLENIPPSWHKNRETGADWFTGFMKRNPVLSIRTPEATSAGRASAFNRHNVSEFFSKLGEILLKHKLTPSRIWNLDETGVTTVLKPKKIVAQKGTKQVGAIVSAERGTLVTVELAASAAGNTIPPMFVFPRLKYKDLFLRDGPPESVGAGNSSGWMTATEFLTYMDHFIKFTKPTPEEPVLLLLDNHSSHIDINVVEKAKANSIIMLSFPPHCTHMLQPLDVGINGPFKTYCAKAQDNWLRNNPGKTLSIYEIPGIVKTAWPLAATPTNIMNAFKKTGICPYNPQVFTDEDFAPSFVTDRPLPEATSSQAVSNEVPPQPSSGSISAQYDDQPGPSNVQILPQNDVQPEPLTTLISVQNDEQPQHSTTNQSDVHQTDSSILNTDQELQLTPAKTNVTAVFSPEIVKPLPKAPPRLLMSTKRRIRKTAILTDTPEKNALAEEQTKKKTKKNEDIAKKGKGKNKENSKGKDKGKGKGKGKSQGKAKRRVLQESETDSDNDLEWYCIICCDAYSNSRPREQWIECTMCKNWAHIKCLDKGDEVTYVCPNCESDEEMSIE